MNVDTQQMRTILVHVPAGCSLVPRLSACYSRAKVKHARGPGNEAKLGVCLVHNQQVHVERFNLVKHTRTLQ